MFGVLTRVILVIVLVVGCAQTGKRYEVATPVCQAALDSVLALEACAAASAGSSSVGALGEDITAAGRLHLLDQACAATLAAHRSPVTPLFTAMLGGADAAHPSVWEAAYWLLRVAAVLSCLIAAAVLLYEYELE